MKRFITFFFHPKDNSRFKDIRKYCIRDSIKTSLIVGPAVTVAVFLFLLISLIWPDSYGQGGYLKTYRVLYLCILLGLMLYELTLIFVDRYFDAHYSKIPVINVGAAVLLILWSIRITMLDYASYGRIDATLYMVISFCIPFCLYMDARMYFMMTVASDIVMVALFLNEGVDAAFNKSNLGDFLVFIGIHFILGLAAMYFKYNMREQLLEQEDQKEEIRQLNQAQSRFFSNMSHEIRTPINTIIGLNEIILRENASEEINEDAENIQAASKMLLNLINDILDMSKFESGQMKLAESAYQTGNMLSDIVGMLWIRAKEKNLEFHIDISPDLPSELYGDEMRIKQILINILNNAIKYTEKGRIRLAIQCRREGDGTAVVTYSVSDTGMGIRSESIPYLFTAFKRVDEEKNHYIEGTGLGLSIVKQLVDLMGGKITVNSVYTKGSTFVIEIPQRIINDEHIGVIDMEKKRSGRIDHKHVDPFRAESAKVLVVDDTTANLMVVEKLLKGTGVQLTKATSGYEALRLTMEEAYNVILMDHKMPGMDGIECMHQIRKQTGGLSNYARIIALTANAGENVEQLYEREGFDGYLTKPVSGEELEYTLYRNLPKDMITFTGSASSMARESMAWISSHRKKVAVRITTDSVADVPVELLKKYDIAEILHMVRTKDGLFKDRLEIDTNGLLAYMEDKSAMVETVSPSVEDYESFFSKQLDQAGSVVHVSISSRVAQSGCPTAMEAALSFGNVNVMDTWHLSTGQGLMAIEAARLAQKGLSADMIVSRMEAMRSHVHTSFIVDTLEFLARQKQVQARVAHLAQAFMIHPVISLKKGKMDVSGVFFGSRERAWEKYINSVFNVPGQIDKRMLFITYVGMSAKDLDGVREMVEKKMDFEEIYIQKASPAIASNCGPGTFGLLFFTKYD